VALASLLKQNGAQVYLGITVQAMSVRRYGTLESLRRMVTRSAFTQLRHSWVLVGFTLAGMAVLFGVPFVDTVLVTARLIPMRSVDLVFLMSASSGFSMGFMITAYSPFLRLYRMPVVWGLTLPAAAAIYAAMTVESAWIHSFGGGPEWKGRRSASTEPRP